MTKVRISLATKKENSEVRNVEDLWEIFSKEDLENFRSRCGDFWKAIKDKYIYFLALVAIIPIVMVIASVVMHFQFGYNIPWVNVLNHQTAAHWGQLGDFVGGILNPLLSFVAFIAVLINLVLQRRDLALAREEAREANKNQRMQSRIFENQNQTIERQNFESTFFRLLDMHAQQAAVAAANQTNTRNIKVGPECFSWIRGHYLTEVTYGAEISGFFQNNLDRYSDLHSLALSRYFRNLHQILKFVDGYGNVSSLRGGNFVGVRIRKAVRQYDTQRTYANMLRAQLSNDEQCCIFLNCLTAKGAGLKYYVEKYSLLKGIELPVSYRVDEVDGLYQSIAYADSEQITKPQLLSVVMQKYKNLGYKFDEENSDASFEL